MVKTKSPIGFRNGLILNPVVIQGDGSWGGLPFPCSLLNHIRLESRITAHKKTTTNTQFLYLYYYYLPPNIMLTDHTVSYVHHTNGGDELVSYMARVSNPSNQANTKTSAKLIKYLIKHQHWSPFEMVSMCVEINTTRSVAAQILRHRSFSFQEFSQRYSEVELLGSPYQPEFRLQDTKNRQNSIDGTIAGEPWYRKEIDDLYATSLSLYNRLLKKGVAKEVARDILPLATPSRLYMHGTLRSWIHYIQLRCGNGTQREHQYIAEQVKELLTSYFPQVMEGLESA